MLLLIRSKLSKWTSRAESSSGLRLEELLALDEATTTITAALVNDLWNALKATTDTESLSYIQGVRKWSVWCRQQAIAPKSSQARIVLRLKSKRPVNQSPNSDVYRSRLRGKDVALKSIRVHGDAREALARALDLASPVWQCVRHPNITQFLGITDALPVCLVAEWMPGGALMTYLHDHPYEYRISHLTDIVHGLAYIHKLGIVHGCLKGANILLDSSHHARITDFGLSVAISQVPLVSTHDPYDTARWTAPELHDNDPNDASIGMYTEASDIYAMAMTFWEIFTGKVPFGEIRGEMRVVMAIKYKNLRPPRPHVETASAIGLTDALWKAIEYGWNTMPSARPSLEQFKRILQDPTSSEDPQSWHVVGNQTIEVPAITSLSTDSNLPQSGGLPSALPTPPPEGRRLAEIIASVDSDELDRAQTIVLIEELSQALDKGASASRELYAHGLSQLRRMCRVHEVLPRSYEVHGVTLDGGSISSGALSSIHCGSLAGQKVAVKSLRNHQEAAQDNITQMYRAEAVLWRHLHSPHIIPCLGVSDILPLSIVSVWMPGGTIIGWIQQHPHANRASLLHGVAQGLTYLHSLDIIHGDIKGTNVLIDADGHARIGDLGLSAMLDFGIASFQGSARWMAPELHADENDSLIGHHSKASDVYALAITCWEVYTGQLPFPDIRGDIKVIQDVLHQDLRPPKPADDPAWLGLTNEIWDLMQDGWAKAPSARPGAERFEEILASHVVVPAVEETKLRLLQETLDES